MEEMHLELKYISVSPAASLPVTVQPNISVGQLKQAVAERARALGVEPPSVEHQRLVFRGRVLRDDQSLSASGVSDGDAVTLIRVLPEVAPLPRKEAPAVPAFNPFAATPSAFPAFPAFPAARAFPDQAGPGGAANPFANPQTLALMQRAAVDPQFMQLLSTMNPELARALNDPRMRAMLSDPAMLAQLGQRTQQPEQPLRFTAPTPHHPLPAQQQQQQQQQTTAASSVPSVPSAAPTIDFNALFAPRPAPSSAASHDPAAAFAAGSASTAAPPQDPATLYASQLQMLRDMGFFDQQTGLQVLMEAGGDVDGAVERLLSMGLLE